MGGDSESNGQLWDIPDRGEEIMMVSDGGVEDAAQSPIQGWPTTHIRLILHEILANHGTHFW